MHLKNVFFHKSISKLARFVWPYSKWFMFNKIARNDNIMYKTLHSKKKSWKKKFHYFFFFFLISNSENRLWKKLDPRFRSYYVQIQNLEYVILFLLYKIIYNFIIQSYHAVIEWMSKIYCQEKYHKKLTVMWTIFAG